MDKILKKKIDDTADKLLENEAPKYRLTPEEVKACAEQMADPEYRAEIRGFAKEQIKKRKRKDSDNHKGVTK